MFDSKLSTTGTTLSLAMLAAGMTVALPVIAAPEVNVRGRVHMDAAFHSEDQVPLGDGFLNRRARMGLSGKINSDWSFQIEYDFAENGTSANDVKLMYGVAGGRLSIGQFKVPMSLNELTSSNSITFIERASDSNLIADARRLGIGFDRFTGNFGFETMLYSRGIGDTALTTPGGDNPIGLAGRLVFNPIRSDDHMVHLGLSTAYEDRRDYQTLRFRDRPESRPAGVRLIDSGNIVNADTTLKTGAELAYQAGPFSAEAEYLRVDVGRDAGDEPVFDGYHIQASYVLTGESRGYRDGVFRGVTPQGQGGAWEVAARYSSANLNDSGFTGGKQKNITLGVNYYANANVRFMANYILVDVEGSSAVANGVEVGDDSPSILALRAQVNW